jgi:putative sporulation protein YyaC
MFKSFAARSFSSPFKIDHTAPHAVHVLSDRLIGYLNKTHASHEIIIVCIGTDRSTGDSLGPLVGTRLALFLKEADPESRIHIFGTLEKPVHAINLKDTLEKIRSEYKNPFVIAVDACLGQLSSVGLVTLAEGALKPGAGVNKDLPAIGDIHLTGIVNVGGFMEYFVLQNTRLSVVMRMADCIAHSLIDALRRTVLRSRDSFFLRIRS